jgi:exodeoxyribonuclease-3
VASSSATAEPPRICRVRRLPGWNGSPAPVRLAGHACRLLAQGQPVVLAGDFNVIPTEQDAARPKRWSDDALCFPESRAAYRGLLAQGWTDALRALHPGEPVYTFWDYFRNAFGRDDGIRIDHLLVSPDLADRLTAAGVDRDVRGWEKTSDHAPTWIELADRPGRAKGRRGRRRLT